MHDVAKPETKTLKVKSRRKIVMKAVFAVVGLFVVLVLIKGLQIFTMMKTPPPNEVATVASAQVKEEDWAPILSSVGSVSAVQGAVVSAELAGTVSEIKFENGGIAKKGDVLVKLDTSSEDAQLKTAEADLEWARRDLARTRDL